jgi:hypothetical protein
MCWKAKLPVYTKQQYTPMKTTIQSIPMHSLLACAVLLGSTAFAHADVVLKGNVGPKTIDDNVVIARNTTCVLNGTTVKGNITVRAGATLYTKGAVVTGNVQAYNSFLLDLKRFTRVNGDVQGKGTRSVLVRGGTKVGGNVQLVEHSAPASVDALLVDNADVDGAVQAEKGTGRLRVLATVIGGGLQFVENKGVFIIRDNRVGADLQFFKNTGAGTITGNHVGGNLQSKENSPAPQVSNNVVEGSTELE